MIVVDTSAIYAILQGEPEGPVFLDRISDGGGGVLSAASVVELGVVLSGRREAQVAVQELLRLPFLEVVPLDVEQAMIAIEAYRRYGKGHHPARLNFGDSFSYALSRRRNLPLLFKGDDFAQTDVEPALPAEQPVD